MKIRNGVATSYAKIPPKEKFIPRVNIRNVYEIDISEDDLVRNLLRLSESESVCLLDSCGVGHLGSHLLIAGIVPDETTEFTNENPDKTLSELERELANDQANFFTMSYDFGLKLENVSKRQKENATVHEPDVFLASFDSLVIHDYETGKTFLSGDELNFEMLASKLLVTSLEFDKNVGFVSEVKSNFSKSEYTKKIDEIQELIRDGETYQTNFTQQFRANLPPSLTPQQIFWSLRKDHPSPFAAFIKRPNDYVISISPERFFTIDSDFQKIKTSPIKGTRPRGNNEQEDELLKSELLSSKKDIAENTMIADLLRNDIGRVCDFGSVKVEKLCEIEEHPSLFHLVSTVAGDVRNKTTFSEIIKAIFPCGSITGCPKIRTMEIIDRLETADRGLSMGAIGYKGFDGAFDLNVAIRTMVIRGSEAIFNVGGGIVIDSDPELEYQETLTKAKAIFDAIGVKYE